jgi:hypothetical protein
MVLAAIVHKHQFKRLLGVLHHGLQAVIELGYVLLFVVKRDDD